MNKMKEGIKDEPKANNPWGDRDRNDVSKHNFISSNKSNSIQKKISRLLHKAKGYF